MGHLGHSEQNEQTMTKLELPRPEKLGNEYSQCTLFRDNFDEHFQPSPLVLRLGGLSLGG